MHFQWNPYVGKLVRTIHGRLIDLILDIRKGSLTFGKMIAYDMPNRSDERHAEWIWVPPGFAHGTCCPENTLIEYLCTGEYNPSCETGISPLAPDIDWSLCDPILRGVVDFTVRSGALITDKDRNGLSVAAWRHDPRSAEFVYEQAAPLRLRRAA